MCRRFFSRSGVNEKASADCGYFNEAAVAHSSLALVDLQVPSGRQKHGQVVPKMFRSGRKLPFSET